MFMSTSVFVFNTNVEVLKFKTTESYLSFQFLLRDDHINTAVRFRLYFNIANMFYSSSKQT